MCVRVCVCVCVCVLMHLYTKTNTADLIIWDFNICLYICDDDDDDDDDDDGADDDAGPLPIQDMEHMGSIGWMCVCVCVCACVCETSGGIRCAKCVKWAEDQWDVFCVRLQ